jgi:hypothetical protein
MLCALSVAGLRLRSVVLLEHVKEPRADQTNDVTLFRAARQRLEIV